MSVTPAQENVIFLSCISSIANRLKESNSKLASIEIILDEYYNGGYTTIGELAGEISCVLNGEDDDWEKIIHRSWF